MNLREFYQTCGEDSEAGDRARKLLDQQHWYASIAEFDPRTGYALPLAFDVLVRRIAHLEETTPRRDRLWRIVKHSSDAIERLFVSLSENPRREQAILPIRDVKELNATSFIALSRRPGRNVREKLAGRPYMQAVRRYQSVDLPENRLLKEFVTRLADALELRREWLQDEDVLRGDIYRWLRTDEAQAISRWDNVPPNNTLLSHRDYRRIWDAWKWLQSLDEDLNRDFAELASRAATIEQWDGYGRDYAGQATVFGEMPVLFDYDAFGIKPWREPISRSAAVADRLVGDGALASDPVCVDLAYTRPQYAVSGEREGSVMPEVFIWQRWQDDEESVDLELYGADAVLMHPDSTTLSTLDLLFTEDSDKFLLERAAHAFAHRLGARFTDPALLWLVPDFVNEFGLQTLRRSLNAKFAGAEPLPRSVAAAFEQINHAKIKRDGYEVLVVDHAHGTTYATKLVARHDPELKDRVPATRGFYWERSPHVVLNVSDVPETSLSGIPIVDEDGRWRDEQPLPDSPTVDQSDLKRHPQIGGFDVCITVRKSPVSGGVRLHQLQRQASDIPLWRDHIPELSIKVFKDGRYEPFFLVSRGTTIRPMRDVAVPIPVRERFTLPAGKQYFAFALYQGEDSDDLGYVARLESPSFPLSTDVVCALTMTYTYGADDPYRLVFEPIGKSFRPVRATWSPKGEDEIVTDAAAPEYPEPASWDDLQHEYNPGREYNPKKPATTDFLEWATRSTRDLVADASAAGNVLQARVTKGWETHPKGWRYALARRDDGDSVYVHERGLSGTTSHSAVTVGAEIYFLNVERGDRVQARYVGTTEESVAESLVSSIRRSAYVPYIRVWSDGRSLQDGDCPARFRTQMAGGLAELARLLDSATLPGSVANEIRFLLACTHRDMPPRAARDLVMRARAGTIDEKSLGFALGDLSQEWQRGLFADLVSSSDRRALRVLARAIWRHSEFVRAFDEAGLTDAANKVSGAIEEFVGRTHFGPRELGNVTRYGELLLGLLRSRASGEEQVRMVLQPHQPITKRLVEQVERVASAVESGPVPMESRVQVDGLPLKPDGDRTPDLLYALRLYLTGDVGANAIRVTSVSDSED